jgi:hypothetical protein
VADRRDTDPAGEPVPRDMPDQLAGAGEDPWEVPTGHAEDTAAAEEQGETSSEDVPDTDEAGTDRQDTPSTPGTSPEQPVPDESPA